MKRAVALFTTAILMLLCLTSCGSSGGLKGKHHVEMVIKDYGTVKIELDGESGTSHRGQLC